MTTDSSLLKGNLLALILSSLLIFAGGSAKLLAQTPQISSQPTPQAAIVGGRAIFTVIASGTPPLSYQWNKDGTNIAGATNDVLILTNVQLSAAGQYAVLITNAAGSAPSTNAGLSVRNPQAGDVDSSFNTGSGINGYLNSVVPQPDGKILIAGSLTAIAGATRGHIARLNADFSTDHTFMNGMSGANGDVSSLVLQPDGKVLIGGFFTSVNSTNHKGIARLNADGGLDTQFNANLSYGSILCAALQPDGKVLIGGYAVGFGDGNSYIARLNANGSRDLQFQNYCCDGPDKFVTSIALQPDGKILIGGQFTNVSGFTRNFIARLNSNGQVDTQFNPATGYRDFLLGVKSIALQPDGKVLIGGDFNEGALKRLNTNGTFDVGFNGGLNEVSEVKLQADGRILVSHSFGVARLDASGNFDSGFNVQVPSVFFQSPSVSSIAQQSDGRILIGGSFRSVNGTNRDYIARLNTNGLLDSALAPNTGLNGVVSSVARQTDGRLLVGGQFTSVRGVPRNRIARLNPGGGIDVSFNPGTGVNAGIEAIALQPDGMAVLAGSFTSFNDVSRNGIARVTTNGVLDAGFNPGSGANGSLTSLARLTDGTGRFMIGGGFSSFNGTNRNGIARLNSNGGLDLAFNPGSGADGVVYWLALQPDGKILIAGSFVTVNGTNRSGLARLNANGGLDLGFDPGLGAYNGSATAWALQPDGKVLIGGYFSFFHGNNRRGLARVNADGTLDLSFNPGLTPRTNQYYTEVYSLAVQSDGKILFSGDFAGIDGANSTGFARLNVDGTRDATFDAGSGPNGYTGEIAFLPDGKIIVAGSFGGVNGAPSSYLARLHSSLPAQPPASISIEPASQTIGAGENATFRVDATGTLPIVYQWRKNGTDIPGATNYFHTIVNAQTNHAGNYSVFLSNIFGMASNSSALLTVFPTAFASAGAIALPVGTNKGNPYPSQITVADYLGPAGAVSVTLSNVTHARPDDLDILLVGPGGQKIMLMSDAGGGTANAITNVTLTFADAAILSLPTTKLTNGTYRPTDLSPGEDLPPPAPPGSYGTSFLAFSGTDPNGVWSLYVSDDVSASNGGSIAGWRINLPRAVPPQIAFAVQDQTARRCETATFSVNASGTAPLSYQWYFSNSPITGATNFNYIRPLVTTADAGAYYVTVTNFGGSVTSTIAALTIDFGPENDNLACATILSGTNLVFSARNFSATAEAGEPSHSSASGAEALHSIWYQWTAPFTGGAVISATPDFITPSVAVYINPPAVIAMSNLVRVADNSSLFGKLRCAFTAVVGQTYFIALDGAPLFGGETGKGSFDVALNLTPPPANDLFANATIIAKNYFTDVGTFLGAGREAGEPTHGAPDFPQTLWWTWEAPTNTANSTIPVRLVADAVSFPPAIRVYVGNTVGILGIPILLSFTTTTNRFSNVSSDTFSMTREATFTATPGGTYRIALAGQQHSGNVISPRFGNFRFRLNTRALGLSVSNMQTFSTFGNARSLSGTARISNLGPATSHPLRLIVFVGSGVSVQGQDYGYDSVQQQVLSTTDITPLPSGQTTALDINGTIPPISQNSSNGVGWGAFIELQEQPFGGVWFTVDQALIGFNDWPTLNDSPGPGGGVIRLDPNYFNISAAAELQAVDLLGSPGVVEGGSFPYRGKATYDNTATVLFTNTAWTVTNTAGLASRFTVTTNGILTVGNIISNTLVTLKAPYSSGGVLYNVTTNLFVTNLPPPTLSGVKLLSKSNLVFTINGVPGRSNRVEATTNLLFNTNTIWLPVLTNAPTSGVFNFTNVIPANVPKRFFRAREVN